MIQTATYEIVTHLGSGGMGDRNVYPMHGELGRVDGELPDCAEFGGFDV